MRALVLSLLLLALPLSACAEPASDEIAATVSEESGYEGRWSGTLETGGSRLRLLLEIEADSATLISLDQNNARLPIDITQRDAAGFAGTIASVGASIDLDRISDDALSGTFSQGGATLPLSLRRQAAADQAGDRPALPPSIGQDEEVTVVSGDVSLSGALRRPETGGASPAVLLLNGSGSQDRDGLVFGRPVTEVVASALAGRGIASLRLDDRGVGNSSAIAPNDFDDLAGDAAAAVGFLRRQGGIAGQCVGVFGHSQGGMIAFITAQMVPVDFIISAAPPTAPLSDILYEQSEAIILASGAPQAAADQNRSLQTAMFTVMRDSSVEDYPSALTQALMDLGLPAPSAEQQGQIWGQAFAVNALDTPVAPYFAAYEGPVVAILAEDDLQILADPARARLTGARADRPTEIITLEGLNHLFQATETGLPQDYANAPHAMAPEALDAIGDAAESLIAQACE
ncbi:alpha/beta hydrolase family protein [Hyphobacterium sp.]|jgi:hypothetical protein|uniref:alpha/beta hydrolase family protein n=1 Tax=Hyphobacterium sp. TaxID=2004662 RepID=UPI003BA8DF49